MQLLYATLDKKKKGQNPQTRGMFRCYLDLPRRKRPVVDSFCVLNPPQYTTGKLGGRDAMCCHVSNALLLRARGLYSSMFVFTIWKEKPGGSAPFSWNVWGHYVKETISSGINSCRFWANYEAPHTKQFSVIIIVQKIYFSDPVYARTCLLRSLRV